MAKRKNTEVNKVSKDAEVKPAVNKKMEAKSKKMTAMNFSNIAALNKGTKFWVNKFYKETDLRTQTEWGVEFLNQKAISKTNKIFNS